MLDKKVFIVILVGILISISFSFYNTKKFDIIDSENQSPMVKGDLLHIWKEAESFKNDIKNNKNILSAGIEYTRTYLPSKLLAIYSIITDKKLFYDFDKLIVSKGGKIQYLILQIILYYSCVFYFYKKYREFFNSEKKSLIILLILAFEPTINQWHSSFWTESVFISLQIFFLGMIMSNSRSNIFYFFIGVLLGILFLQKTIALFLIFPFLIFIFISKFEKKLIKATASLLGLFIVLFYLGYSNYLKTGIFYIMPLQAKYAHYSYMVPMIYEKSNNEVEKMNAFVNQEKKWMEEQNINLELFGDKYKFVNYQKQKSIEVMKDNIIVTLYIYIKNTIHHFLLNPVQVYYWHKYNQIEFSSIEYHVSKDKDKWFVPRIIYSSIVYLIILAGFINIIIKKEKIYFYLFILICVIYYSTMLGWMGNTRYFMPSFALLPLFITEGLALLFKVEN